MKNKLVIGAAALGMSLSLSAFAGHNSDDMAIGVVNMQQVLQSAPQVKQINAQLKDQFSKRKSDILAQAKVLQANMSNFDKNKTVLGAKDLATLRNKITSEETQLRTEQMSYQQDLMTAQNNAMNSFLKTLKASVSVVAAKKKLALVLPENTLLYSAPEADITNDVLKNLQGK